MRLVSCSIHKVELVVVSCYSLVISKSNDCLLNEI